MTYERSSALLCLAAATALALVALAGCSWVRGNVAQQMAIERELDAYLIDAPLEDVWVQASEPFFSSGILYHWERTGPGTMRTQSHREEDERTNETVTTVTWFEAEVQPQAGGIRVRFYEVTDETIVRNGRTSGPSRSRNRRTDYELDLVAHFDPAAARRIETAGADARRQAEAE